jgi:hypothetical protein
VRAIWNFGHRRFRFVAPRGGVLKKLKMLVGRANLLKNAGNSNHALEQTDHDFAICDRIGAITPLSSLVYGLESVGA